MAQHFLLKRRKDGFDLFTRDLIPASEVNRRIQHMVDDMGFTQFQAEREVELMLCGYQRRNEKPSTYALCEQFTFQHVKPGDIVTFERPDNTFIVNRPATC